MIRSISNALPWGCRHSFLARALAFSSFALTPAYGILPAIIGQSLRSSAEEYLLINVRNTTMLRASEVAPMIANSTTPGNASSTTTRGPNPLEQCTQPFIIEATVMGVNHTTEGIEVGDDIDIYGYTLSYNNGASEDCAVLQDLLAIHEAPELPSSWCGMVYLDYHHAGVEQSSSPSSSSEKRESRSNPRFVPADGFNSFQEYDNDRAECTITPVAPEHSNITANNQTETGGGLRRRRKYV